MSRAKIQLAKPFFKDDDIEAYKGLIEEILKSGRLTLGKYLAEFEKIIAKYTGSKHAIAMNSATSALHAAMLALRIGPGDEVIVPTYTFASTVNAPLYVGARPVLADSDPDTFNISIDDVLEKIKRGKTKAIIPVHIAGNPVDMKSLIEIAEDYQLLIVEDAAHALGSLYQGRHVGALGSIGIFSFYPNKIITTGEGGAATTNNDEYAKRLKLIRSVGREALGPVDVVTLGYNYRMSEINAALGLIQMRKIEGILGKRRRIAKLYNHLIKAKLADVIEPQKVTPGSIPSYYAYIIRIKDERINRDQLRKYLLEKHGIETTIIYKPVHTLTYYRRIFGDIKLPIAEELGIKNIALPIHPYMDNGDVKIVVDALEEAVNYYIK